MVDILLIEDDTKDEALTVSALDRHGSAKNIKVVHDGAAALEYLFCTGEYADRQSENPRLILIDLKLPEVHGIEVLRKIRAEPRTRFIPTVVFTASNEESDTVEAYDLGVNSYIVKPGDVAQFNKTVDRIAHYWLVINRQPVHTIEPTIGRYSAALFGMVHAN